MEHLFVIVTTITFSLLSNAESQTINGKLGEIVGNLVTIPLDDLPFKNVHQYLGIPFAKPPIGELRFSKPEPITSLPSSPFSAQKTSAYCPQIAYPEVPREQQNEDCLYLNVYVPERPADKTSGHAVMIWVYGGGYQMGGANQYDFSVLAVAANIIVVTFNYRVGPFGFLSTGDEHARGNYGLWDQHTVFKWVHDNIEDFGGDTQRVTIAGESAGAMSVIQHALTPANQGYFQRIIAQSGSPSSPAFDYNRDVFAEVKAVADQLNCEYHSRDELMNCLREKSVDDFLNVLREIGINLYFSPVVDNDLIKKNPKYIGKAENWYSDEVQFLRSLDMLSGFNAHEGVTMFSSMIPLLPPELGIKEITDMSPTPEQMREMYLPALMILSYHNVFIKEIMRAVEAQYTNWTNPDDSTSILLQMDKLAGDTTFCVPAIAMARLHKMSSAKRNFMYHFVPKPSNRVTPQPEWVPGAAHADEIPFMMGAFGYLGVGDENSWENELIIRMMTYWSNFVKSGNPNEPEAITPSWPDYSVERGDYLVLDKVMSETSARPYFYAEEANFWLEVFPDLAEAVKDTDHCGDGDFTSAAPTIQVVNRAVLVALTISLSVVFLL